MKAEKRSDKHKKFRTTHERVSYGIDHMHELIENPSVNLPKAINPVIIKQEHCVVSDSIAPG